MNNPDAVCRLAVTIRDALESDVPAIHAIYAQHVLHGVATFEMTPPPLADMHARLAAIRTQGMPWLVACSDDTVLGYAYASTYRARPAYRFTIEDSIYLAPQAHGRGVGRSLLAALIERCEQGPWRQMVAVISGRGSEASVGLHAALGFVDAGTLRNVGFKHDQWLDTMFMQRALGAGAVQPPPADY